MISEFQLRWANSRPSGCCERMRGSLLSAITCPAWLSKHASLLSPTGTPEINTCQQARRPSPSSAPQRHTMANFAPYQDVPETTRALSPPPLPSPRVASPRASVDRTRNIGTAAVHSPTSQSYQQRDYFGSQQEPERVAWNAPGGFGGPREDVDMFETRLGLRMDYEACLAYLLLPPAGPVLLLMLEHRSDYVRYEACRPVPENEQTRESNPLLLANSSVDNILSSY